MLADEPPFFLSNKEWYTWDREQFKYVLTDKAPAEAVKSYNEVYSKLDDPWGFKSMTKEQLVEWATAEEGRLKAEDARNKKK